LGNAALQNGLMVHIQTLNKEVDWDIQQHKSEECLILLQHAETNMHSRYPNFQGGYMEESYELKQNNVLTGNITVGFYGPYSLGDSELQLINLINRVLIMIGLSLFVVSTLLSILVSKSVTKPIKRVIDTAKIISEGDYGVSIEQVSTMKETKELYESINHMSYALSKNEQQKKQITADVAHELRTPLNNLLNQLEAMIDKVWDPTEDKLKSCHGEVLRLIDIVRQLQELYIIENNVSILDKTCFDFHKLMELVISEFKVPLENKDIDIKIDVPLDAPVYGDEKRLKQCFINLITNSISYTDQNGNIKIKYFEEDNNIFITVSDNGCGISEEDLPHIFERFFRADKSRIHKTGSMGIGLSITKAIIEAHGGKIYAESKLETGSKFTIILPVT